MKKTMKDELIKDGIVFVFLFITQRWFNSFVYETDGISVLFGIFLLGISFILHIIIDDLIVRCKLKRKLRKLEKELEELKKKYEV